jgi:hypothetical protein
MKSLIASTSVLGLALAASISAHAASIFTPGDPVLGGASDGTNFNVGVAGTAGGVNNWPPNEPPTAAIDGAGQKYLNFFELNTGILVTPSFNGGNGSVVTSMTLWTANDAVERDPTSYQVLGTNVPIAGGGPFPLSDFTEISSGGLALPATRNAGGTAPLLPANSQTVTFTNSTSYKSYLVLFPTVTNSASANSMQIAEIQLDGVVPEPATAGLAVLSLATLLVRRRR